MCGRFGLWMSWEQLRSVWGVAGDQELSARFNISPGQDALVLREDGFADLRWGLLPSWADHDLGARLFNARAESVDVKPAFRAAYTRRRCIVPVSAFYEWVGSVGGKQPFLFSHELPFGLCGVWEHWEQDGQKIESFSILTRPASKHVQKYHDRMPVAIRPQRKDDWLKNAQLPITEIDYDIKAVSKQLNDSSNEGPELIQPAGLV